MTTSPLNWRNARLPPGTAVFAVGDIHAHDGLLQTMLRAIERKIAALPSDTQAQVIFIGDYIDRGPSSPDTIDLLLDFEKRMAGNPHGATIFLCGNHDEYAKRLLDAREIIDEGDGISKDMPEDWTYLTTQEGGRLTLRGLETWLFVGGGVTTFKNYCPELDDALFDPGNKRFNRLYPGYDISMINTLVYTFIARMPPQHKDFLARLYGNSHVILGDYLFTHAGIDPAQALDAQGIGSTAPPLRGMPYFDFLMIRDPFLWRDDLPNCPYVVVHGHTPSAIASDSSIIADGQKDYRLCIDTAIYEPNGALTCFVRHDGEAGFMAVNRASPGRIVEYNIP